MNKDQDSDRLTAVAIQYDPQKDIAPRVTAKGQGIVAEKIIELAAKHRVPIRKDPALVQVLSKLDIDEHIPAELYKAIAEILSFVYRMNESWRERQKFP
jgi:flagellar biosynthesis protein